MKNVIIKISSLSLLVCMLFVSCGGEKTCGPDSEHLNVNKDRVMRYVLCLLITSLLMLIYLEAS